VATPGGIAAVQDGSEGTVPQVTRGNGVDVGLTELTKLLLGRDANAQGAAARRCPGSTLLLTRGIIKRMSDARSNANRPVSFWWRAAQNGRG
jgi:hypothetical protein